eukprot:CAMPEP_0172330792 /NCGR_PEP_ID=MMETSP1058-20130122/61586_1 /TAXON_ID=83371 /ORGANISM="Detonula confervacea, Strain CCMP 353" /LENGTH=470 /DNA_ID=CAMNT_0013048021 /DNA_START=1317 /DNA_END=2726 /DNA_ORIENTATION=-
MTVPNNSMRQRKLMLFISVMIPTIFTFHQSLSLQLPSTTESDGAPAAWHPNNEKNSVDLFTELTTPKAASVLVHFDPYFIGGFRNQHMRFVAFVNFAVNHNISQILLPSLRWGDAFNKGMSAPHELLFDVIYWNERAVEMGLPRLVRYDQEILEGTVGSTSNETALVSCFNSSSNLYAGLDEQNLRSPSTNLRKTMSWNFIGKDELYSHCRRTPGDGGENNPDSIRREWENKQSIDGARLEGAENIVHRYTHLIPHGGMGGVGRLWTDYNQMQNKRAKTSQSITSNIHIIHPEHVHVEKAIYTLMQPSKPIRLAIEDATNERITDSTTYKTRLLALHPRIEQDMAVHRCSKHMEANLTKIFGHLRNVPTFDILFLAVNKAKVDVAPTTNVFSNAPHLRKIAIENSILLNHTRSHGLTLTDDGKGIPIFESGLHTAAKIRFPNTHTRSNIDQSDNQTLLAAESLGVIDLVA